MCVLPPRGCRRRCRQRAAAQRPVDASDGGRPRVDVVPTNRGVTGRHAVDDREVRALGGDPDDSVPKLSVTTVSTWPRWLVNNFRNAFETFSRAWPAPCSELTGRAVRAGRLATCERSPGPSVERSYR